MDFIYKAIKKAESEGRFDSRIMPDASDSPTASSVVAGRATGRSELFANLPTNVLTGLREACENIRKISRSQDKHIIGMTSPDSGAGTTTSVILMAKMLTGMYDSGRVDRSDNNLADGREYADRVLVVDAQTREPVLHRLLGIDANPGLADAQRNGMKRDSIIRTAGVNLDVITMGGVDRKYDIVALASHLGELLQRVRDEYDFIILDLMSIPKSSKEFLFDKLCDAVILVVHSGRSNFRSVQEACLCLRNANVPIVGSLINRSEYQIPELISRWL